MLEGKVKASINIVNLAEIYYILHRRSREAAEEKEGNLRSYGVNVVPVEAESPLWKKAASLKAQHTMSLVDAFAAATALDLKSRLVTGAERGFRHSRVDFGESVGGFSGPMTQAVLTG